MPSILKDLQGPGKGFTGFLGLLIQFEASRGRNAHILRRRRMQAGTERPAAAAEPARDGTGAMTAALPGMATAAMAQRRCGKRQCRLAGERRKCFA